MAGSGMRDSAILEIFIEIPKGSRNKYEYDEKTGAIRLDRVLYSSVHYPTDYGFIVDALAPDGDHLDVLVFTTEPTFPGCRLTSRAFGVLHMRDDKGQDDKILAVPVRDPHFEAVFELQDISGHWLREIENFFTIYKLLEDKLTDITGWGDVDEAIEIIEQCRAAAHGHAKKS